MTATIERLPDSVLLHVFSHISQRKLCKLATVCRRWKRIAYDGYLWRNVSLASVRQYFIKDLIGKPLGKQLRVLTLWRCTVSPENLYALSRSCPQLEELYLKRNIISDPKTKKVKPACFPRLVIMDARGIEENADVIMKILRSAVSIKKLALDNTMDGFFDASAFKKARNLQVLDCSRCLGIVDQDLRTIAMFCSKLEYLSIMRCYGIQGGGLPSIIRNCPMLKTLSMAYTSITNEALLACEFENSQIDELDISHCPGVSSVGVLSVVTRLKDMTYLNANGCSYGFGVDRQILRTVARYKSLEVLDLDALEGTEGADEELIAITENCPNIEVLRIRKGLGTVNGMKQCLQNLKNLKRFGLVNLRRDYLDRGMEVEHVLNNLAKYCPRLEILELGDFRDREFKRKTSAFTRLMRRCRRLRKIAIFTDNRDMFVMAAEARIKAQREKIRLIQPTMMCPTPRVVTPLPKGCFDRLVYGESSTLDDDDPWRARVYY